MFNVGRPKSWKFKIAVNGISPLHGPPFALGIHQTLYSSKPPPINTSLLLLYLLPFLSLPHTLYSNSSFSLSLFLLLLLRYQFHHSNHHHCIILVRPYLLTKSYAYILSSMFLCKFRHVYCFNHGFCLDYNIMSLLLMLFLFVSHYSSNIFIFLHCMSFFMWYLQQSFHSIPFSVVFVK